MLSIIQIFSEKSSEILEYILFQNFINEARSVGASDTAGDGENGPKRRAHKSGNRTSYESKHRPSFENKFENKSHDLTPLLANH